MVNGAAETCSEDGCVCGVDVVVRRVMWTDEEGWGVPGAGGKLV